MAADILSDTGPIACAELAFRMDPNDDGSLPEALKDARAHLAARLAELEAALASANGYIAEYMAAAEARATRAEVELAVMRVDAERYRWLRDSKRLEDGVEDGGLYVGIESPERWGLAGEEADVAIDAARGEGG